jgi:hypothetical protein
VNARIQPVNGFRVAVRDGSTSLGCLDLADTVDQARDQLERVRRAYPESTLQGLFTDGDLGAWRDITDDDLNRIAAAAAAHTLATIYTRPGLERITWVLSDYEPGKLGGQAYTREQVEAYARVLNLELTETAGAAPLVRAKGTVHGVEVCVSCYARPAVEANASTAAAVTR